MSQMSTIQFHLEYATPGFDYAGPSLYDLTITSQSLLNPFYGHSSYTGAVYDAWCLDKTAQIDVPGNYSATLYSTYELNSIAANVHNATLGQNLDKLDSVNWLINWYDGTQAGISKGEVQAAIWKLMGQDWTSEAYYLGQVDQADVNTLVQNALWNDGFVPQPGQHMALLVDASASGASAQQPLIIEVCASAIGDTVFDDVNGNGLQDSTEFGIAGAKVELVRDLDGDGRFTSAGEVVSTTTTDAYGSYMFSAVAPGVTYQVRFTMPAGYDVASPRQVDGNPDGSYNSDGLLSDPITLQMGECDWTIDAGFYKLASIGDRVWLDANSNGVQDSGEAGAANVAVKLLDASGQVLATQQTAADGSYLFQGLQPGRYVVEFDKPTGYTFTSADAGGNDSRDSDANPATGRSAVVDLSAGEQDASVDAGLVAVAPPPPPPPPQLAHIGNRVWEDANANGIQDAGELGIAGAQILLKDTAGNVLQTTMTDAQGLYGFDVAAGSYTLQVVVPATSGYAASPRDAGSDDSADTDIDANGVTGVVTVVAGEVNNTVDMGGYRRASLGDTVWLDANANGVQDAGETGVAGVTVNLLNAAGQVVSSQATDAGGQYLFGDLVPGNYQVQVVAPQGHRFTSADAGGDDARDSDVAVATGTSGVIELSSGEAERSVDAGLVAVAPPPPPPPQLAHIGNRVWEDANANGVQDAGELGIAGAQILLKDTAGNVLQTTMTDAQGLYGFDVAAGSYTLQVVVPATSGYAASPRDAGSDDSADTDIDANGVTGLVTVVAGEVNNTVDMGGYRRASLGDTVWLDANANGVQDAGETGVAGVTVNLLNAAGQVVSSQTTDAGGQYLFADLVPGNYQVQVVAPQGHRFTSADAGGDDARDSDVAVATGTSGVIELSSGEAERSVDAGLVAVAPPPPVGTASIGNFVFEDVNFNGVQDSGERGLDGLTVRLLDAQGAVLRSTTTAAGGQYLFDQLAAGNYQVEVAAPTGWYVTKPNQGNDAADSDIDTSTGRTTTIQLAAGQADLTVDAGLYRKAAIGDRVWSDANHNGVQDSGEGGIAGIRVTLLDGSGTQTLGSTTTDGLGNYRFTDLNPGDYRVQFDKLDVLYTPGTGNTFNLNQWSWAMKDVFGSSDAADSDVDPSATNAPTSRTGVVTLQSGETNNTIDAGVTPIVLDLDGDGVETIARGATTGSGFDLFGTGQAVASGWVGADDGLLAVDRDGNGRIDGLSELFGGTREGDGFARLAGFDSNGDGRVDAADAGFDTLRVWRDADGDQFTDAGELMTLAEAGIASLGTGYAALPALDAAGNLHLERGSATRSDGQSIDMTDVYFAVSADDAAAAGVALPSLAELMGDDRSLDGLLGASAAAPAALAPLATADAFGAAAADWLNVAAALCRDEHALVGA